VTKNTASRPAGPTDRCAYCRRPLPERTTPGRPARYCSRSHRQRAYEARRLAARVGLPDGVVAVERGALDRLFDDLYGLEAALEDVEQDLRLDDSEREVRAALTHLVEAATVLRGRSWEPLSGSF
jgi:hypothetical protein